MLRPTPWLLLLVGLTACGGTVTSSTSDAGPLYVDPPSNTALDYGYVYARQTNTVIVNGQPAYELGSALTAPALAPSPCAGATRTAQSCCYVPPAAAPAGGGGAPGGLAGRNPDGGLSSVGENAGHLAFNDVSTNALLGSADYGQVPTGFGTGEGYAVQLINPTIWNDGDAITVTAAGASDGVPAFSARAIAVKMPTTTPLTSIDHSASLTLTWTPDPNAGQMRVRLTAAAKSVEHGSIACTVPDSTGTVTIDATLLQDFEPGDSCWTDLERVAVDRVDLAAHSQVTFETSALDEVIVPVK